MSLAASMRGFPEWLPDGQLVEQSVLASLRSTFELHGFGPLDTRAVETLEALTGKGETDKEIYVLRRLQASPDEADLGLGLHFDLTVPFARYVRENAGRLAFPFRRYQIQKCWRGERPQEGRYREFLQADIDVVDRGSLPAHLEWEVPLVAAEALGRLHLPPVRVQVNNRKIVQGFFEGLGYTGEMAAALRALDKFAKIGPDGVAAELEAAGVAPRQVGACLRLGAVSSTDLSFVDEVRAIGVSGGLLDEGLAELSAVMEAGRAVEPGLFVADLRITRGLDYYTGTVYETLMEGYESLGSVCSGGRYDDLVGAAGEPYPGVGISIGVSRILGPLLSRGGLRASRLVPSCVLVAVADEEHRPDSEAVAAGLRRRLVPTEVSPTSAKYGKQIRYAERRGIPFVWFPGGGDGPDQVRDIRSGEQLEADASSWLPPEEDRLVTVAAAP